MCEPFARLYMNFIAVENEEHTHVVATVTLLHVHRWLTNLLNLVSPLVDTKKKIL
jgi:hypothetical protein